MSDQPDTLMVRMLRWIDSGVPRLMERVGRTEQAVSVTQVFTKKITTTLERIGARLDQIEQRLPPKPSSTRMAEAEVGLSDTNRAIGALPPGITGEV